MIYNVIAYTLIRAAFEKGLQKVLENPEREIRNLIDLGNDFSKGGNQKHFFEMAAKELESDDSIYYRLAERAIRNTNPEVILDFGLNLGYNSWVHGTRIIRDTEEKRGHHVPWVISFYFDGNTTVTTDDVVSIIRQGKKLGIFSYVFYLTAEYHMLNDLFSIFEREKECAFFLFVPPSTITESRAVRLVEARTVFTAIDMDDSDAATRAAAAALLQEYNCLRGGFCRAANMADSSRLDEADRLGFPFVCLLPTENGEIKFPGKEPSGVIGLRQDLQKPIFPMDLLGDIVMVDRYISKNASIAIVKGDGTFMVKNIDTENSGLNFNACKTPLAEILQHVMPRDGQSSSGLEPLSSST